MWGLGVKSEQVGTCLSTTTFFFLNKRKEKTVKLLTMKSYIVASLFNEAFEFVLSMPTRKLNWILGLTKVIKKEGSKR